MSDHDQSAIEEKVIRFQKLGIGSDLATLVAKSELVDLFETYIKKFK